MRKIISFGKEMTIEEYVKKEICKNAGTQSIAFKDQLISLCNSLEIPYEEKMRKEELFDLIVKSGYGCNQLADKFGVGVSSQIYQKTFNISHKTVKCFEKHGVLKKVGEYRFRAYGKYMYAPLYDIYQFASMSEEEMQQLLNEYSK